MKDLRYLLAALITIISSAAFAQVVITGETTVPIESTPVYLNLSDYQGSIQWQRSDDEINWDDISQATDETLEVPADENWFYRARVTAGACEPFYSETVFIGMQQKQIAGQLMLPEKAGNINPADLTVVSATDLTITDDDGNFEVGEVDELSHHTYFVENDAGESIMLAYDYGNSDEIVINAESTALALMMMNPYQTLTDEAIIKEYMLNVQNHANYSALISEIENQIAEGGDLFADDNTALVDLVASIIKDATIPDKKRGEIPDYLSLSYEGTKMILGGSENYVSYFGGLYKKGDVYPIQQFVLPGKTFDKAEINDIYGKLLGDYFPLAKDKKFEIDLADYEAGSYYVRLRNGGATSGDENTKAYSLNIYSLCAYYLNIIPMSDLAKRQFNNSKCIISLFTSYYNALNGKEVVTKMDYLSAFKDVLDVAYNDCFGGEPKTSPSSKNEAMESSFMKKLKNTNKIWTFFGNVMKSASLIDMTVTTGYYLSDLAASEEIVNYCVFYEKQHNNQLYGCFTLEKVPLQDDTAFVCEKGYMTTKVKLVEESRFDNGNGIYPIEDLHITWIEDENRATASPPDGATFNTDKAGRSTAVWDISDESGEYTLSATVDGYEDSVHYSVQVNDYSNVKIFSSGNNQAGESYKELTEDLTVYLVDEKDDFELNLDQFEIEWKVTSGGGELAKSTLNDDFTTASKWILGNTDQEQKVEVSIKYCDGRHLDGSPFEFTVGEGKEKILSSLPDKQWNITYCSFLNSDRGGVYNDLVERESWDDVNEWYDHDQAYVSDLSFPLMENDMLVFSFRYYWTNWTYVPSLDLTLDTHRFPETGDIKRGYIVKYDASTDSYKLMIETYYLDEFIYNCDLSVTYENGVLTLETVGEGEYYEYPGQEFQGIYITPNFKIVLE